MVPTQFSYIRNTFGDCRGRLWLLALVLVLGLSSIPDRALTQRLSPATEKTSLGVWSGVSFDSPGGPLLGRVRNREFFIVGIRYGRMLAESDKTDDIAGPLAICNGVMTRRSSPSGTWKVYQDKRLLKK